MAARALIFDLDGTIWDSASWFAHALAIETGGPIEPFERLLRGTGNIVAEISRTGIGRRSFLRGAFDRLGPPKVYPAARSTLDQLGIAGERLGVVTSLPGSIALPMLVACELEDAFGTIVHAGRCRTPKPHPRGIHMALQELGVNATPESFYVGDRLVDAEAADRAGVSFLWVSHGYEMPEAASGIEARDVSDLLAL